MRIVVLTRNARGIASRLIARGSVDVEAVLLAEGSRPSRRARLRKLRRLGPGAVPAGLLLRRAYAAAQAGTPSLDELGVRVVRVASLNGATARAQLERLAPEVGISLDSPLLAEATFAIPDHGVVNVHHGAVPEYRGGPPIFWELRDGRTSVGYTVHRIDAGIDTGPVLAAGQVAIQRRGTLAATLGATLPLLFDASLDALERVLAAGCLDGEPQTRRGRLRTTPTLRDYLRVERALRNYDQRP